MKPLRNSLPHLFYQKIFFAIVVALAVGTQVFFFANMMMWRSAPDRGWVVMAQLGPKVIGVTRPLGEAAGLRKGDNILAINGASYSTLEELEHLLDLRIGQTNVYTIQREGASLTIPVKTQPLGWMRVVMQSGTYWGIGTLFIGVAVIVFMMKPWHGPSWAFLIMTLILGILLTYFWPSYNYTPSWLDNVFLFLAWIFPASILHLTALFPEKKRYFAEKNFWIFALYLFSFSLAVVSRSFATRLLDAPPLLLTIIHLYLLTALFLFLTSTIYSYVTTSSVAVRLQSLVIFSGFGLALFTPVADLVSTLLLKISFFPNPIFFYLFFFGFFPLSIGYAIVRHDLFEIDVLVRRTYGYVLSTSTIVGAYAFLVSGMNAVFQSGEISQSPLFSIAFAIGVVFTFNPLHNRIQRFVDRGFYRLQYDYRKTITNISEAMTSMLDPTLIQQTLIGSAVKEMFLENGMLLLISDNGDCYRVSTSEGENLREVSGQTLFKENVVIQIFRKNQRAIFRHDLEQHPRYEAVRKPLQSIFEKFLSELMIPLHYKGELRGIVSFGRKKSGKMFTLEDLDLLTTMISQSAIALENASLVEQMKKDLTVRTNLARYLSPQIVDQIIEKDVQVDLGGDRKVVTILFSDIRNFTSITETRPPDQLVAILNEYFTEMAGIIFGNQGSLDKYIGDAIVAVFGSLIPLENSALAATRAAKAMMERMPVLNEKWKREYHFGMDIGIGLNTGEVFLGNIGSPERMEFTVIGDTVNVASRFSGLAKAGQILMTKETRAYLNGTVAYKELPASAVKGKSGKLEVYEVACA